LIRNIDPHLMKKILLFWFTANLLCAQDSPFNQGVIRQVNYFESIPFEFIEQKIIIPVSIAGVTYRFMVDTGAPNFISQKIFNKIKPEVVDEILMSDANNIEIKTPLAEIEELKIGSLIFNNSPVLVNENDADIFFKCWKLDGIIGSNLLRNSIVQINLEEKLLYLTDRIDRLDLNHLRPSKMITDFDRQSTPFAWIDMQEGKGKHEDFVMLDTGMHGIYDLSQYSYQRMKEKKPFPVLGTAQGAGVIGFHGDAEFSQQFRVQLPFIQFNNFILTNVVSITTVSNYSRMGAGILKYGTLTLDYINDTFYFDPKIEGVDLEHPLIGFSTTLSDNKIVIGFVWDDSLKDKIQYGDEILQIDNLSYSGIPLCDLIIDDKETWHENKEAIFVKVRSTSGEIISFHHQKRCP